MNMQHPDGAMRSRCRVQSNLSMQSPVNIELFICKCGNTLVPSLSRRLCSQLGCIYSLKLCLTLSIKNSVVGGEYLKCISLQLQKCLFPTTLCVHVSQVHTPGAHPTDDAAVGSCRGKPSSPHPRPSAAHYQRRQRLGRGHSAAGKVRSSDLKRIFLWSLNVLYCRLENFIECWQKSSFQHGENTDTRLD